MPVRFSDISNLTSPKAVVRVLEVLFGCAAFSLAASSGAARSSAFAAFAMFTWCFSFAATLVTFLVEFTQFHSLLPFSWKNLPVTLAAFAALMNLAASVTYPLMVMTVGCPRPWGRPPCSYQTAATICSCLAFLAYSAEVYIVKAEPADRGGYMATGPGLLKVLEVFVACVLFVSLATGAIPDSLGFRLCVAALCACAFMSLVVIVMMVGECRGRCPVPLARLLVAFNTLAVLMYAAVLVNWALHLSRQSDIVTGCPQMDCPKNQMVMSAFLTGVNLLAYVADLIYSIKLTCPRN
ncbi:myeloid-associated differentiation marker homolog [Heptranchias perlo]|uniref:myeloid-associated differentiation marker homolog n=1 Tax=Heptranchias perlo TaxID=212740 RepID=UPI003559425D